MGGKRRIFFIRQTFIITIPLNNFSRKKMKPPKLFIIRNKIVTAIFLSLAILIMSTPALANSSSWSFTSTVEGMVLDGSKNGVFHTMTAGTLTNSGSIYVASAQPCCSTTNPASWTITVKKYNWPLFDSTICSVTVTPSKMVGSQYKVSFTKNCGTIAAGKYYLYITRGGGSTDGRQVVGSGTLTTP